MLFPIDIGIIQELSANEQLQKFLTIRDIRCPELKT